MNEVLVRGKKSLTTFASHLKLFKLRENKSFEGKLDLRFDLKNLGSRMSQYNNLPINLLYVVGSYNGSQIYL